MPFPLVYPNIQLRCQLASIPRNRQDAIEAIDIAARGKVKVVFEQKSLADLKKCAIFSLFIVGVQR